MPHAAFLSCNFASDAAVSPRKTVNLAIHKWITRQFQTTTTPQSPNGKTRDQQPKSAKTWGLCRQSFLIPAQPTEWSDRLGTENA